MTDRDKFFTDNLVVWLSYATALTKDPDSAPDLVHDAYVKLACRVAPFNSDNHFRAWVFSVIKNKFVSDLRHIKVRRKFRKTLHLENRAIEAADSFMSTENKEEIQNAIGQLKDDDRVVIYMRYFLDMSHADIAAAICIDPAAARQRYSRAMFRLGSILTRGDR